MNQWVPVNNLDLQKKNIFLFQAIRGFYPGGFQEMGANRLEGKPENSEMVTSIIFYREGDGDDGSNWGQKGGQVMMKEKKE